MDELLTDLLKKAHEAFPEQIKEPKNTEMWKSDGMNFASLAKQPEPFPGGNSYLKSSGLAAKLQYLMKSEAGTSADIKVEEITFGYVVRVKSLDNK